MNNVVNISYVEENIMGSYPGYTTTKKQPKQADSTNEELVNILWKFKNVRVRKEAAEENEDWIFLLSFLTTFKNMHIIIIKLTITRCILRPVNIRLHLFLECAKSENVSEKSDYLNLFYLSLSFILKVIFLSFSLY